MKTYTTNKTIFENNKCGAYDTAEYNFPLANEFSFLQLYSYDEDFILFDCDYIIDSEECPNCKMKSYTTKNKYVYPVIGEINGKVINTRIRKHNLKLRKFDS